MSCSIAVVGGKEITLRNALISLNPATELIRLFVPSADKLLRKPITGNPGCCDACEGGGVNRRHGFGDRSAPNHRSTRWSRDSRSAVSLLRRELVLFLPAATAACAAAATVQIYRTCRRSGAPRQGRVSVSW